MKPPNTVISDARNHHTPIFPVGMPVAVKVSALLSNKIPPTALLLLTAREADPAAASPWQPRASYTRRGYGRRPARFQSYREEVATRCSTPECWPAMDFFRLPFPETGSKRN